MTLADLASNIKLMLLFFAALWLLDALWGGGHK